MRITDIIAAQINAMLEESDGIARIQRNELAGKIGCVPSQINYVITSRYTLENGYLVESRRGGGGFIQIVKLNYASREVIFHVVHSIGDEIDEGSARMILQNLTYDKILTPKECKIISAALQEQTLKCLPDETRRRVRASLMKIMLLHCAE